MRPRGIVVHHTVTRENISALAINEMHIARGFKKIGYHFLIRREGFDVIVEEGRRRNELGAHCPGHQDCLGIAVAGNFDENHIAGDMFDTLVSLVSALAEEYDFKRDDITYHAMHSKTLCPGRFLIERWDEILTSALRTG
jgi:hypothetical protein